MAEGKSKTGVVKKRASKREKKDWIAAYIFIAPVTLGLLVFYIWPFIQNIWFSFNEVSKFNVATFCGLANYQKLFHDGISRFRFRGRGFLSYFILTTQVLPGSLLIIPLYVIMGNLQLLDTKIGLVAAYCTFSIPFCTWMMKGFFDTIPISLEEAARVDGAGRFRIFATVILPLTVPGLVATGIFSFINGWNEYLFASTFMKSYENWTLPIGIASFSGQYATNWGTLMAGAVLITLPVVIMFLLLQKHLVSGMTAGAVKQ